MVIKTDSDYLAHHGIPGQKWGERNGPPYPLGSGQKSYQEKKLSKGKGSLGDRAFDRNIKQGKDKPNISPAEKVVKDTKGAVESTNKLNDDIIKFKQDAQGKKDLSEYTDQELRDMVNRLQLERTYQSLTEPELTKGEEYAKKTLSLTGDILDIALSTVGIMATIYTIRKGMGKKA